MIGPVEGCSFDGGGEGCAAAGAREECAEAACVEAEVLVGALDVGWTLSGRRYTGHDCWKRWHTAMEGEVSKRQRYCAHSYPIFRTFTVDEEAGGDAHAVHSQVACDALLRLSYARDVVQSGRRTMMFPSVWFSLNRFAYSGPHAEKAY